MFAPYNNQAPVSSTEDASQFVTLTDIAEIMQVMEDCYTILD